MAKLAEMNRPALNGVPNPIATSVDPPSPTVKTKKRLGLRVLVGAILVTTVLTSMYVAATLPRLRQTERLRIAAQEAATSPPQVTTVKAQLQPGKFEQSLPGNATAFREAALYAQSTGYLSDWKFDIGDKVSQGQVVATISAPDLDDQLAQAQANLEQSRATLKLNEANAALAEVTAKPTVRHKI